MRFALMKQVRQLPDHCGRCGMKCGSKRCDKCKAKVAKLKKKQLAKVAIATLALDLQRRVESLELAIAQLQLQGQRDYKRIYQKA